MILPILPETYIINPVIADRLHEIEFQIEELLQREGIEIRYIHVHEDVMPSFYPYGHNPTQISWEPSGKCKIAIGIDEHFLLKPLDYDLLDSPFQQKWYLRDERIAHSIDKNLLFVTKLLSINRIGNGDQAIIINSETGGIVFEPEHDYSGTFEQMMVIIKNSNYNRFIS